jgi:hypothetical protein
MTTAKTRRQSRLAPAHLFNELIAPTPTVAAQRTVEQWFGADKNNPATHLGRSLPDEHRTLPLGLFTCAITVQDRGAFLGPLVTEPKLTLRRLAKTITALECNRYEPCRR